MKPSQKLIVHVENVKFVQRFDELDSKLLRLVEKLEELGDEFGPVNMVIFEPNEMFVSMGYADKRRGPVSKTIFGYDSKEFMRKQYEKY